MSYFQIIDPRQNCTSVYFNGKITRKFDPSIMTMTWAYHPMFAENFVELGQILANGKSLEEVCPDHLKEKFMEIKNLHIAYERSFKEAKVDTREHCFYDFLPLSFVESYFGLKNEITEYVFTNYRKQKNYNLMHDLVRITDNISKKKLNINLSDADPELKLRLDQVDHKIKYNPFGSITGRMTTKKNSFPVLTLEKDSRDVIRPTKDFFVEMDFNAAELRTFFALNKIQQPMMDLHQWHLELNNHHFSETLNRDEMKKKFFAWLYSGKETRFGIEEIDNAYDRNRIIGNYYWDGMVHTPFGRQIVVEQRKALNNVVQSTAADIFYSRVSAIDKLLKDNNLKSFISILIHDSLILDFCKDEVNFLSAIENIFSNTEFGKFITTVKIGNKLSKMKVVKI